MKGIRRASRKRKKAWTALFVAVMAAAMLMTGCSSSNHNDANSATGISEELQSIANDAAPAADSKASASGEASSADDSLANTAEGGGSVMPAIAASGEAIQGKIIYTANLTMAVEELKTASTTLRDAIHQSGGYILQFNDSRYDGEMGANYTIKVPAGSFMSFIDRLADIPNKKFERELSGKDVSEEYVDLESRLHAAQLVEERLLSMMDKATRADDLLEFSNKLASVEEKIEEIKGRMRYLDNNVAYSTVNLRIYQTNKSLIAGTDEEEGFGSRLRNVLEGSTDAVVQTIQVLLLILVGALPVLAIVAIIAIPVMMTVRSRNRSRGNGSASRRRLEPAKWGEIVKDPKVNDEAGMKETAPMEADQATSGQVDREDAPQKKD
ncbi:DUF4349 domain-containing protein [Paenibacillus sp. HB172176]|uniref:DUF4349 domain-containing protein n=1 Tax=Paenibacillus sp. HB172176 TaxID=2493690 RepID=UPI00143B56E3|nr:DUF4349 domain-containing protein [Paenibacillus sp. HB172176]